MATKKRDRTSGADAVEALRRNGMLTGNEEVRRVLEELDIHRTELEAEQAELARTRLDLEAALDRYESLFDFAPIGYAVLDAKGVIHHLNLTVSEMMQSERGPAYGLPFMAFVVPSGRRAFLDFLAACRRGGTVEIETELLGRHGRTIPVHLRAKRMPAGGKDTILVALVDLTERRRLAVARREAEEERRRLAHDEEIARRASEAKDRFIAMLSHELRTPLAPVLFTLGAVTRRDIPPELVKPLELIRRNVELEARLIDDLLDMTRIARGKMQVAHEVVDVHELVQEVVADQVHTPDFEVALDLAAPASHVRGDPLRLRQVVWNVVRNAMQHTPEHGRIAISTTNAADGALVLTVRDTGAGIPPGLLSHIFDPFEQGSMRDQARGGLGLGLAIAKGVVDAHGGRIAAASAGPGGGTVVTIELVTVPPPEAARKPRPAAIPPPAPRRILLVEDDPDNATAIAEFLRLHGYTVHLASSVTGALAEAEKGFDVLVSDIGLPDGTGRDIVRRLSHRRRVPAIALTGYGMGKDVEANRAAGFVRHLTKPVDPQHLIEAINDVVTR
jgi:PAS domain S-box-containing protein